MNRFAVVFSVCALGAVGAGSALAVSGEQRAETRYQMHATEKGFVRLDTVSGEVSTCREDGDALDCELAEDDRAAYRRKIEALTEEVRHLREGTNADRTDETPDSPANSSLSGEGLPSTAEIDEAIGLMEYAIKRLMGAARTIDEELTDREDATE